jgi:hypothetical protein
VTLTATWLLPIALIPGTWQVYDPEALPDAPQITEGQAPSQPEPSEADNAIAAETQKEEDPVEEKVRDETVPEPKASTSQEPHKDQPWGSPSSSYTSKNQPPQGYWDPSLSGMWIHPEYGYPNPMYSSSSSSHFAQSHYPPGAYFTPMPGYGTPMYGYYQPVNPQQTPETHEPMVEGPMAPPPVVMHTVPLPSSRPNTPPRRRR